MKKHSIEISKITLSNLLSGLDAVRGCWKATTMLWMHAMGLPVLSGIIVPNWSEEAATLVAGFSRRNKFSDLLLRIDKPGQRWTARRGGYLLPVSEAQKTSKELTRERMIAIFLEPASPYSNHYALGALVIPDEAKIVVEVVGAGFDASDILRSDLQPHERFEIPLPAEGNRKTSLANRAWDRTYLIGSAAYRESVAQRLAKIGARLENPAFPDRVFNSASVSRKELISRAMAYLKDSGQRLLLRHSTDYEPITPSYFGRFVRGLYSLMSGLASYGIHLGATSVSSSVIYDRKLVFWDFFPAKRMDTSTLASKVPPSTRRPPGGR
ncbi:MAG TPA: hypothetical protein VG204_02355 [Terriglobia bacterium]|nr:hypothetical protein [Terriglobia bacterium]